MNRANNNMNKKKKKGKNSNNGLLLQQQQNAHYFHAHPPHPHLSHAPPQFAYAGAEQEGGKTIILNPFKRRSNFKSGQQNGLFSAQQLNIRHHQTFPHVQQQQPNKPGCKVLWDYFRCTAVKEVHF